MNELEMFVIGEVALMDQLEAHLLVMHSKTPCLCQQRAIMQRIRRVQTHRAMLITWQNREPNRENV